MDIVSYQELQNDITNNNIILYSIQINNEEIKIIDLMKELDDVNNLNKSYHIIMEVGDKYIYLDKPTNYKEMIKYFNKTNNDNRINIPKTNSDTETNKKFRIINPKLFFETIGNYGLDIYILNFDKEPGITLNTEYSYIRKNITDSYIILIYNNNEFTYLNKTNFKDIFNRLYNQLQDKLILDYTRSINICNGKQVRNGLVGLKNLGNTCYMNAVMQCLRCIIPLRNYICNHIYQGNKIVELFFYFIQAMWTDNISEFDLSSFRIKFVKSYPYFNNFCQHDSHEFLTNLIDILNEE
jgi:hypothetical protein